MYTNNHFSECDYDSLPKKAILSGGNDVCLQTPGYPDTYPPSTKEKIVVKIGGGCPVFSLTFAPEGMDIKGEITEKECKGDKIMLQATPLLVGIINILLWPPLSSKSIEIGGLSTGH